jgi:hypothetical protein
MRSFYIFTVLLFTGFLLHAQTPAADEVEPYHFDTTLKGGYSISFKANDSLQYLYLKKGKKTIAALSSTSKGLLYKNLGYVGADFTNYFVLVHSFGGGNPHYIELIKKATGRNSLQGGAAWIDADEKKELLLYCNHDVPGKKDKMILLNVKTGQQQYFSFPDDIFEEPGVLNRIQIRSLTDKQLVITYDTPNGARTTTYNRR